MIKPERRRHTVRAYVTKTQKGVYGHEARKRGISVSDLIKVSVFEFLSPKVVPKSMGIVRIDRVPKGSVEWGHRHDFRLCLKELKTVLEKRKEK